MFQVEWAQTEVWERENNSFGESDSKLNPADVRRVHWLYWEDHCLECAPPLCYTSCSLYSSRADKACARFRYGIYPNPRFKGLFDFGADIRFRRWGKLETIVQGKIASVRSQRLMDGVNRFLTFSPREFSASHHRTDSARSLTGTSKVIWKKNLAKVRNKCFSWLASSAESKFADEFVLECFSPDDEPFRLVLEYSVGRMSSDHTFVGAIKLRHCFNIVPGWNFETLPAEVFGFGKDNRAGKITVYPENNAERRLIFTWLDLVQYHKTRRPGTVAHRLAPASKIKCVAWDLDNTVWNGILAEDGQNNVILRGDALNLIKRLDEKGIIQTVVSKNNQADALAQIERLGLREYFLYPAINWQQKSSNLKGIAAKLNINLDTFALIDDSPFERAEVQSTLPQVRVYSDTQIAELLAYPEFDVPVTEASRKRRESYQTEVTRQMELESFGGDYESFLRSCEMKLHLFVPREEGQILRCLELIQRANQLNLSGKRYSDTQFHQLLAQPRVLCVAMECRDRFGDYGIVGFASIDESQQKPVIRDFVLSCRVAQKKIEHTFVQWLAAREMARGMQVLCSALVRTGRNQPLLKVFDDLGFMEQVQQDENALGNDMMELPLKANKSTDKIVSLVVEEGLQPALLDPVLVP